MNVKKAIQKRRSIREFENQPISDKQLQSLMEVIQLAPSASNIQSYKFIIVKDEYLKTELGNLSSNQTFISNAAVIFVGIGNPSREKWYKVDVAIAMEHLALQAVELGLGSCWIGAFDEEKIKNLLKIPKNLRIIALMPIGISAQNPPARPRKSLNELFLTNYYQ
ncbi:MAG: nitroreductase family protein [Promethearchaeota archaeon]